MQAAMPMAARPVFSCSMVAACTFIMLLLIIVLVAADALDTPYYLNHLISTQNFGRRSKWRLPSSFLLNILALTRVISAMLFRSSLSSADVTSTLLLAVALLIFLLAAGIHHAVVHHYRLTDGNWLMGFFAALPFYLSREIRDREKLGHWDWAGLWWPTAGLIVVLAVLEIGSALWRRRTKATSTNARSSEADAAPAAGRT